MALDHRISLFFRDYNLLYHKILDVWASIIDGAGSEVQGDRSPVIVLGLRSFEFRWLSNITSILPGDLFVVDGQRISWKVKNFRFNATRLGRSRYMTLDCERTTYPIIESPIAFTPGVAPVYVAPDPPMPVDSAPDPEPETVPSFFPDDTLPIPPTDFPEPDVNPEIFEPGSGEVSETPTYRLGFLQGQTIVWNYTSYDFPTLQGGRYRLLTPPTVVRPGQSFYIWISYHVLLVLWDENTFGGPRGGIQGVNTGFFDLVVEGQNGAIAGQQNIQNSYGELPGFINDHVFVVSTLGFDPTRTGFLPEITDHVFVQFFTTVYSNGFSAGEYYKHPYVWLPYRYGVVVGESGPYPEAKYSTAGYKIPSSLGQRIGQQYSASMAGTDALSVDIPTRENNPAIQYNWSGVGAGYSEGLLVIIRPREGYVVTDVSIVVGDDVVWLAENRPMLDSLDWYPEGSGNYNREEVVAKWGENVRLWYTDIIDDPLPVSDRTVRVTWGREGDVSVIPVPVFVAPVPFNPNPVRVCVDYYEYAYDIGGEVFAANEIYLRPLEVDIYINTTYPDRLIHRTEVAGQVARGCEFSEVSFVPMAGDLSVDIPTRMNVVRDPSPTPNTSPEVDSSDKYTEGLYVRVLGEPYKDTEEPIDELRTVVGVSIVGEADVVFSTSSLFLTTPAVGYNWRTPVTYFWTDVVNDPLPAGDRTIRITWSIP